MPNYNRHLFFAHPGDDRQEIDEDLLALRCACSHAGPYHPPADLFETEDGTIARFEVAGCRAESLRLQLNDTVLRLIGRRRDACPHAKKSYLQMEIHYGTFERSLTLPRRVDPARVTACCRDGLLEVFLPKTSAPRSPSTTVIRIQTQEDS